MSAIFLPLVVFFFFGAGGLYLISEGVDANFNLMQISAGWLLVVTACSALAIGIIHGDLVPKWLAISENVSAAPGIDASATCYRCAEDVRVLPVVVSELELRQSSRLDDEGNAADA